MHVILIIIGLAICSYQTPIHEWIGGALIAGSILHALFKEKKPVAKTPASGKSDSNSGDYTGRVHGDTYCGVYDRDGNYIPETELIPTIDGGYITPNRDHVEQDSDGEYRIY